MYHANSHEPLDLKVRYRACKTRLAAKSSLRVCEIGSLATAIEKQQRMQIQSAKERTTCAAVMCSQIVCELENKT